MPECMKEKGPAQGDVNSGDIRSLAIGHHQWFIVNPKKCGNGKKKPPNSHHKKSAAIRKCGVGAKQSEKIRPCNHEHVEPRHTPPPMYPSANPKPEMKPAFSSVEMSFRNE